MNQSHIEAFLQKIYRQALNKANQKQISWSQYQKQIQTQLRQSKLSYERIKHLTSYCKKDWIEDLLEITRDLKLVKQNKQLYNQKLQNRAKMHFSSGHFENLSKLSNKSIATKKVLDMYNKSQLKQWKQSQLANLTNFILQNTIYFLGLTKGNGVIVEQDLFITCAHVFMDQKQKIVRYRCFATGSGTYGIAKINQNGLFINEDIAFGKIIKISEAEKKLNPLLLSIPKSLKFGKQFEQIRCIQVGVLFNNESQSIQIQVFEAAQGFIEQNLYQNDNDYRLIDEMGLLVHNCYGLWGTSGSPLWNAQGQLLGIHNSWNQNGYNISMIVHDDNTTKCRVVKQYERRAIGTHVLFQFFQKWKKNIKSKEQNSIGSTQAEIKQLQTAKKKVKK